MASTTSSPRDPNFTPALLGTSSTDPGTTVTVHTDPTTHRLLVDATTSAAPATSVVSGMRTGVVATPIALATSSTCVKVVVYAYTSNVGTVAVGDSSVVADTGKNGTGEQLLQGAATAIEIDDPSKIYLATANSGDGVSFSIYS